MSNPLKITCTGDKPHIILSARFGAWRTIRNYAARSGVKRVESWGIISRDFTITGPPLAMRRFVTLLWEDETGIGQSLRRMIAKATS